MLENRSFRTRFLALPLGLLLGLLALATLTEAQDKPKEDPNPSSTAKPPTVGDRVGQGLGREQMWRAPTEEEWKRPVLIEFQRTWEDALAVSKETGKAILCCINMDGEIASEHYAGVRYRQPEVAKLYEPYVCVIASTYRHNPRDYDDQGRRILCPRFGSVTCGEHIAIEPILFKKFMDGRRISPRHIMVELDGTETFDVMLLHDTAGVFDQIREGITKRANQPPPLVRGDRPIVERVASPDIHDRRAVEKAYREGDASTRSALLDQATKQGAKTPIDLLRLAIFGLDTDLAAKARATLAKSDSAGAIDLISEALRVPMKDAERDALIAALVRLGKKLPKAQWLAVVHQGMSGRSTVIDPKEWANARSQYEANAKRKNLGELEVDQMARADAHQENPDDPEACIALAESSLDLAREARKVDSGDPRLARAFARHLLDEAHRTALAAEELGAPAWRVNTVIALAAYYRGDRPTAYVRAADAVREMPAGDPGFNAYFILTVFAEGRWEALKKAMDANRPPPPKAISDINAAYTALRDHPLGTDKQVVWHLDFLKWLGIRRAVSRVLAQGLERFPNSGVLHRRLRENVMKARGFEGLEAHYAKLIEDAEEPSARLVWFAGYATQVVAEGYRKNRQGGKALSAYGRAIDLFERCIEMDPGLRMTADRRVALALAGRGHLCLELGDLNHAFDYVIASLERQPATAGTRDGLGLTPGMTAKRLLSALKEKGRMVKAQKLKKAIGKLDPVLLIED